MVGAGMAEIVPPWAPWLMHASSLANVEPSSRCSSCQPPFWQSLALALLPPGAAPTGPATATMASNTRANAVKTELKAVHGTLQGKPTPKGTRRAAPRQSDPKRGDFVALRKLGRFDSTIVMRRMPPGYRIYVL